MTDHETIEAVLNGMLRAFRAHGEEENMSLPPNLTPNLTPSFIDAMADWSRTTLGEGDHLETVLAHVLKEVEEIRRAPKDIEEWADLGILMLDGATRQGFTGESIIEAIRTKVAKNRARQWPKPGTVPAGQPIEHVREPEVER